MYDRVMELIYTTAGQPHGRAAEDIQEDTLHVLGTLKRFRTQPWRDGIVEPAILFVESEAWSLIYLRLRFEKKWAGGEIEPGALANIDESLRNHFQSLFEESRNAPD